jgi:hypothetical protein
VKGCTCITETIVNYKPFPCIVTGLHSSSHLYASLEESKVLARIFHELLSRDRGDGCATWQLVPRYRGIGSEAYLDGTSQVPTPEDARKDGHIIRARCAPLGPASGFPVSWSEQVIHEISGLGAFRCFSMYPSMSCTTSSISKWLESITMASAAGLRGANSRLLSFRSRSTIC